VHDHPKAIYYTYPHPVTVPGAFDVAYWHIGIEPKYDLRRYLPVVLANVVLFFEQNLWLVIVAFCFFCRWWEGALSLRTFRSQGISLLLLIPAAFGIGLFCFIRMEPRYIASFLFLGFVGLVMAMRRLETEADSPSRQTWVAVLLIVFFVGLLVQSLVDQTLRALYSTPEKASYKAVYEELVAVNDYLGKRGLRPGNHVGTFAGSPVEWARMSGVKVLGEIADPGEFIVASPEQRLSGLIALKERGIKIIVAKQARLQRLTDEGWELIPGTRDYYAFSLSKSDENQPKETLLKGNIRPTTVLKKPGSAGPSCGDL
jgi:hypothetical protein